MSDSKALTLNSSGNLQEVFVDSFDKPAITIASAASIDLYNVTSNTIDITGTTTITSFGTPPVDGVKRLVQFIGTLTLTHGTSAGGIRLPGLANITTAIGDMAEFISSGGVWICYSYTKLNGQAVVGGGGGDDGVNFSNICDLAMDGVTLISDLRPYYYKPDVGFAMLHLHGIPIGGNPLLYGTSGAPGEFVSSGTGAFVGSSNGKLTLAAGSTATGLARAYAQINLRTTYDARDFYSTVKNKSRVSRRMAASAVVYFNNPSDATITYSAVVTFLGPGPAGGVSAITNLTPGISLEYTHTANSGNWVIKYRGADTTLKTINTTKTPGFAISTAQRIVVKAHRTAANTATITVNIAGTVYTITDAAFNVDDTYYSLGFSGRIIKTVGTFGVTLTLQHASSASNLL